MFSFIPAANTLSDPERYTAYTASLDDKTETVLKLMAASTVTSAGLSAIPGDTATAMLLAGLTGTARILMLPGDRRKHLREEKLALLPFVTIVYAVEMLAYYAGGELF